MGTVFHSINNPVESVLILEPIFCPKCEKNISGEKCLIKRNEFGFSLAAANILRLTDKKSADIPQHLQNAFCVTQQDFEQLKRICNSKPKLVQKF